MSGGHPEYKIPNEKTEMARVCVYIHKYISTVGLAKTRSENVGDLEVKMAADP